MDRLEKDFQSLEKDHEAAPDPEVMKPEVDGITASMRQIQMNLHRYEKECNEYQVCRDDLVWMCCDAMSC